MLIALLIQLALAPSGWAQEAAPPTAAVATPTEQDNPQYQFLDDAPPTEVQPGGRLIDVDKIFSHEKIVEVLNKQWVLSAALGRVHRRLYHDSNLRSFDPVSGSPYSLQGEALKQLPEDARIVWSMGKDEFIALDLPDWESIFIGAINWQHFLEASAHYKEYKIAHLQLCLMDAQGIKDGPERDALEETRLRHKGAVVLYLNTPPAD
jgi:hypothetical protein